MVSPLLRQPLRLPVRVINIDGLPKIIAGGVPVTPINVALAQWQRYKNTTPEGLDPYTRACILYVEFAGRLRRSIIDITNEDFYTFKDALLGMPFLDGTGAWVRMVGRRERGRRTADLMLSLMYSIGGVIEEIYKVHFDWRRFKGQIPEDIADVIRVMGGIRQSGRSARAHSIKYKPRKIVGLPDEQFIKLILAAKSRWADDISDGDRAYSEDPEGQRGALFYRNIILLFAPRYLGSRRREATFIRLRDIDRIELTINLVTKGHGGERGERLPVILFPFLDKIIWHYVLRFRPEPRGDSKDERERVLLSHSLRNYGMPVGPQTTRKLIDLLRPKLDPPWNNCLTPHMLRHAFSYQLQRLGNPAAHVAGMRHASTGSGTPYSAGPEVFADQYLSEMESEIEKILDRTSLLELIRGGK